MELPNGSWPKPKIDSKSVRFVKKNKACFSVQLVTKCIDVPRDDDTFPYLSYDNI